MHVVITGSTKGIGLGMAREFLQRGHDLVISSRGAAAVDKAVAELKARVTILDKTGTPVAFLGDNPNKAQWANFGVPPQDQQLGIFTAPHGLSFDKAGNLYVQDWNKTGRVTKLTKL